MNPGNGYGSSANSKGRQSLGRSFKGSAAPRFEVRVTGSLAESKSRVHRINGLGNGKLPTSENGNKRGYGFTGLLTPAPLRYYYEPLATKMALHEDVEVVFGDAAGREYSSEASGISGVEEAQS